MLLLIDVDGVLEDTGNIKQDWEKAILNAIAQKHCVSYDEAKRLRAEKQSAMPPERRCTARYVMNELGFPDDEYFGIINSVDRKGKIRLNPNCKEMLDELMKRNMIVTYSNSPRDSTIDALTTLGIIGYMARNFSAQDLPESKPSTKNLEIMMAKMGFAVSNTIIIGDSYEKDCLPAVQLGMKAILYDKEGKYSGKNGVIVVRDLLEIVGIVGKEI